MYIVRENYGPGDQSGKKLLTKRFLHQSTYLGPRKHQKKVLSPTPWGKKVMAILNLVSGIAPLA